MFLSSLNLGSLFITKNDSYISYSTISLTHCIVLMSDCFGKTVIYQSLNSNKEANIQTPE